MDWVIAKRGEIILIANLHNTDCPSFTFKIFSKSIIIKLRLQVLWGIESKRTF
jgi:hypothetical protein